MFGMTGIVPRTGTVKSMGRLFPDLVNGFCQDKLPPIVANCYRAHTRRYKPRLASPFRYFHSSPELIR